MGSSGGQIRAQIALFLGLTANMIGQIFLLTVLPPLGRQLGFSDIQTGAILSVSALILIVSAPAWGFLSERIGRRPVLLIGLAGATFGPVAFSFITGWRLEGGLSAPLALGLFLVARSSQTLLTGGLQPAAQAYIADITPAHRRISGMGLISAAYGLGAIGGAALAWWIGSTPALAFGLIAACVGAAFINLLLCLGEPPRRDVDVGRPAAARLPLAQIWPSLAITLIAFASYSIVQQVIALRLADALGFAMQEAIARAGAALMITALAMVIVQGLVLRLVAARPEPLVRLGTLLAALSMLLCSLAESYPQILGTCILFGVALGCALPGNLAALSLRTNAGAQGKAAGINMIAQGTGLAIGPIAGAGLHHISPQAPFATAALLLLIASGLAITAWRSSNDLVANEAA